MRDGVLGLALVGLSLASNTTLCCFGYLTPKPVSPGCDPRLQVALDYSLGLPEELSGDHQTLNLVGALEDLP